MKNLLLVIAATTSSLFVLLPVKYVRAANLGFTVTENSTDASTPALGLPNAYIPKNLVSAQGQVTSINGFSSLQGINPNSLTFNYGNLQLISQKTDAQKKQLSTTVGNGGQQTPFFNLLENGQVIATSNNITITGVTNVDQSSPNYGQATHIVDVALNGIIGNPFFQEVKQLSNGTGILEFNGGTPSNIAGGGGGNPNASASFTYTGGIAAPSSTVTPTSVPEPSSPLLNTLVVSLWGTGYLLKRKFKNNKKLVVTNC